MKATRQATADLWLRCYSPRPQRRARVVFLPHAGGNSTAFAPFSAAMPADLEGVIVQYPGRMDRSGENWEGGLRQACATITLALTTLSDRPIALFGHSMGAMFAYEIAHLLAERGLSPVHLFVSGRPAPHHSRETSHHILGDDHLWSEMGRLGGTPQEVLEYSGLRPYLMPAIRADYRLAETFRPQLRSSLTCPVTALLGDQDPEVTGTEAAAWADVSTGPFTMHIFDGDHFYLSSLVLPIVHLVADEVRRTLSSGGPS